MPFGPHLVAHQGMRHAYKNIKPCLAITACGRAMHFCTEPSFLFSKAYGCSEAVLIGYSLHGFARAWLCLLIIVPVLSVLCSVLFLRQEHLLKLSRDTERGREGGREREEFS